MMKSASHHDRIKDADGNFWPESESLMQASFSVDARGSLLVFFCVIFRNYLMRSTSLRDRHEQD